MRHQGNIRTGVKQHQHVSKSQHEVKQPKAPAVKFFSKNDGHAMLMFYELQIFLRGFSSIATRRVTDILLINCNKAYGF
jgi:hypothetical protein